MGAAMAPAAYETLRAHFTDTGRTQEDYDLIVTGDLGKLGSELCAGAVPAGQHELGERYQDCGVLLFDLDRQDVRWGALAAAAPPLVLNGHIFNRMRAKQLERCCSAVPEPSIPLLRWDRVNPYRGSATPQRFLTVRSD